MPSPISDLSQKIYESPSFEGRFRKLQNFAAHIRLSFGDGALQPVDIERLILQASVLALSGDLSHKRVAQKINALFHEVSPDDELLNYAIQVISSRLGNFPVISESSKIFGEAGILKKLKADTLMSGPYVFDPEILSNINAEEEQSRLQIKERIYHFNTFQKEIFDALEEKSLVSFSAPTSFGKSFIVRHHIAKQFAEGTMGRVLILVPTKSLIDGFFEDLVKIKRDLNLDFGIFTHTRSVQTDQAHSIFILTQERLSFLINKNPDFLRTFQLVYCDEAHYISRGYRGFVLRDVLRKVVDLCGVAGLNGTTKYIFSSPIIKNPYYYKEKIFPLLPADKSFHKEVQYSPVEKNIHFITKGEERFKYLLLSESSNEQSFDDRLLEIGVRDFPDGLQSETTPKGKIKRDVHVMLNSQLSGRSILYTTSPISAHKYALEIAARVEDRATISAQELEDLTKYIRDHYDDSFGLIELLKKGIGLHYGPMPVGLRRAIVDLFETGKLDYLVCTSTLLEGVNLPAKNIFVFSNKYGGQGGKEKHTPLSFWNLVGRAGRLTYGLSGNVFCVEESADEYQDLIENTESEIKDPETDVLENRTREKYALQTFLDPTKQFDYTKAHGRNDIEYLIFELLTVSRPEILLANFHIEDEERAELLRVIREQRRALSIPLDIIQKNPGIDPRLQDKMYTYLNALSPDTLSAYFDLASSTYSVTGAQLSRVLSLTSQNLYWPKAADVPRISNRITQWVHEFTISGFIQQVLQHLDVGDDAEGRLEKITKAIGIIRGLETDLSYNAPKYFKCFFDIAVFAAQTKGVQNTDVIIEKIEAFLFGLESGVSSLVGRFLFEKGVSRPIAIRTNALIDDVLTIPLSRDFFNRPDIRERLRVGLSKLALKELDEHLRE